MLGYEAPWPETVRFLFNPVLEGVPREADGGDRGKLTSSFVFLVA